MLMHRAFTRSQYRGLSGLLDSWSAEGPFSNDTRRRRTTGILLANHGAIVTGETVMEACYQAVTFERMCRFTYDTLVAKVPARTIDPVARAAIKAGLKKGCPPAFWDGAVRQLLRSEPEVLD